MATAGDSVLTLNAGSSSLKFALYRREEKLNEVFKGAIENIGTKNTWLNFTDGSNKKGKEIHINIQNRSDVISYLFQWLEAQRAFGMVKAIGHRVVYGIKYTSPQCVTPELIKELKAISVYDPEHLPLEIELIERCVDRYPEMVQVACFDTSFHASMPAIAKLLPIPRKFAAMGIQRYGFHGISFAYLMEELENLEGRERAGGKVILAHLGNGASLSAVYKRSSMDTSMGFTPASGLTMATRTGDLDPGVAWYFMEVQKFTPQQFNKLIHHQSGLLGISETSSDMRNLLKARATDSRAGEAVDLFCYQAKKWIGSFAAVLNGLDTLVFSGGIGEHSAEVRAGICEGLQFLGIELDEKRNDNNDAVISSAKSRVQVRVINTNEQLMMARAVYDVTDQ